MGLCKVCDDDLIELKLAQTHVALTGPTRQQVLQLMMTWQPLRGVLKITVVHLHAKTSKNTSSFTNSFTHNFQLISIIYCIFVLRNTTRFSKNRKTNKIGVLKNFAKFIGKHVWESLFFNKVAVLALALHFY